MPSSVPGPVRVFAFIAAAVVTVSLLELMLAQAAPQRAALLACNAARDQLQAQPQAAAEPAAMALPMPAVQAAAVERPR